MLAIHGLSLPIVIDGHMPLAGGSTPVVPDTSQRACPVRDPEPAACAALYSQFLGGLPSFASLILTW